MPPRFTPRGFLIVSSGLGLYAATVYSTYHLYRVHKLPAPPPSIRDPKHQPPHPGVFDALAPEYNAKIGWDERLMRLGSRRRELIAHARGRVLEVSAGTGRNLDYYAENPAVSELTLSDASEPMLLAAYNAFVAMVKAKVPGVPSKTDFKIMDVQHLDSVPAQSYDTVVDTFGLCSCADPLAALKEMARCCAPGGKVLLLEHGTGSYDWLNSILDKTAADHAAKWACWWNRELRGLVEQAGMEVLEMKEYHLGTTLWIVATPRAKDAPGAVQ
ncbi:Methyltransferase-like protein 7B [Geranomyces variabilis]|nr:Methyltransferase-like protein 7B [Geranomyces variabilis]